MRWKSRLVTIACNMVLPTMKAIAAKIQSEFRKNIVTRKSLFDERTQFLQGESLQFGVACVLGIHAL